MTDSQVSTIQCAPMMGYTDKHFRVLMRILSSNIELTTEMVVDKALINKPNLRQVQIPEGEHNTVIQLGGSCPKSLSEASKIAQGKGASGINLNVGCPSHKVQSANIGACLMLTPQKVADAVFAMSDAVSIPVSVKCRIGVDDNDSSDFLHDFINSVKEVGVKHFIVHARSAFLKGLDPKKNRSVPPLQYEKVYQLRHAFPELKISINGGIHCVDEMKEHLTKVDGVMIGRLSYQNPFHLNEIDRVFYGCQKPLKSRANIIGLYLEYLQGEMTTHDKPMAIMRHLPNLVTGIPGAKAWRQGVTKLMHQRAPLNVIKESLNQMIANF